MASMYSNGRTFRERLLSRLIIDPSGCLVWTGPRDRDGYGRIHTHDQGFRTHRAMYEIFAEPIPAGMQLDHLCRNRACANVAHLEPVTHAVNMQRGNPWRILPTHCANGHEFTEANTYRHPKRGSRCCRACNLAAVLRYKAKQVAP